jgi:hypothetical protein
LGNFRAYLRQPTAARRCRRGSWEGDCALFGPVRRGPGGDLTHVRFLVHCLSGICVLAVESLFVAVACSLMIGVPCGCMSCVLFCVHPRLGPIRCVCFGFSRWGGHDGRTRGSSSMPPWATLGRGPGHGSSGGPKNSPFSDCAPPMSLSCPRWPQSLGIILPLYMVLTF